MLKEITDEEGKTISISCYPYSTQSCIFIHGIDRETEESEKYMVMYIAPEKEGETERLGDL